jgi:hypothetical protein
MPPQVSYVRGLSDEEAIAELDALLAAEIHREVCEAGISVQFWDALRCQPFDTLLD